MTFRGTQRHRTLLAALVLGLGAAAVLFFAGCLKPPSPEPLQSGGATPRTAAAGPVDEESMARATFAHFHPGPDGKVSKVQWTSMARDPKEFDKLDTNHDGFLDIEEFKKAMSGPQNEPYNRLDWEPGRAR